MLPRALMRLPAMSQPLHHTRAALPAHGLAPSWTRVGHPTVSGRSISTHALSADDKLEIMELCYKFDTALNTHDTELALDLFTKEAKLQSPKGTVVGQQALREYLKAIEVMAKGNRHLTANIVVEGGNERAHASSCRLLHRASSPPALLATGTIEDTLVKLDGEWKFKERRFIMDPPLPTN